MRLENSTNISDERVQEIIRFVRPSGISGFDVRISNSKYLFAGSAYSNGSSLHKTSNPFIVVRVTNEEEKFPYFAHYKSQTKVHLRPKQGTIKLESKAISKSSGGYLDHLLLSREEALVHVIAHELRHLWQKNHKKGKVWGARGRYSDRDADAYAIRKTREWRRRKFQNSFHLVTYDSVLMLHERV
jgi:hypothetical protein